MKRSSIGDRMKRYENVFQFEMPRRIPVIVRVDGRCFHKVTRKLFGKWDKTFTLFMIETARAIATDMNCKFCYGQSDEISFLLTDYKTIKSEPWLDYDLQKIVSLSASIAGATFSQRVNETVSFDSRAFSVPHDDVVNYFVWRQQDATRNAIHMAGREHFSHKQLQGKNGNEIQEMLFQKKQINFNRFPVTRRRGFALVNKEIDTPIPIFSRKREYIEKWVQVRED